MDKKIQESIEKIRPELQKDGGDIEFVKYEDNIVYVKISGMCMHCHFLDYTLENIESILKEEYPEIQKVELSL